MPTEEKLSLSLLVLMDSLKMVTSEISKFEKLFLDYVKSKYRHILETIRKEGQISKKLDEELRVVIDEFIPGSGLAMKDK
jgi:F0F1-type ATP synthase alpha subunit